MNSLIPFLIALTAFSGCATIYGRQNDETNVHFIANVEGVTVACGGKTVTTPGNIALVQSQTHRCSASKEGFETQTIRVMTVISRKGFGYSTDINMEKWAKWTLGIGVLAAWPVDFISGAMRSLERDRYVIEMKPSQEVGTSEKVLDKTVDITKTLVLMPAKVVDETASAVMDKTVRTGSEAVGLGGEENRQQTENLVEGKKIAKRFGEEEA